MITRIEIDPNVRVRGNGTYAGFEDVEGPLVLGQAVEVYESEADIVGAGKITEIDAARQLVYLSVEWSSLRNPEDHPMHGPSALNADVILQSSGPRGAVLSTVEITCGSMGSRFRAGRGNVHGVKQPDAFKLVSV